jgi:hypothetical protein
MTLEEMTEASRQRLRDIIVEKYQKAKKAGNPTESLVKMLTALDAKRRVV